MADSADGGPGPGEPGGRRGKGGDQGGVGRCRLLQRDERGGVGAERDRPLPGDGTAEASREGGVGPTRSDSQGPVSEAADGAEVEDEEARGEVHEGEGHDGADLRPDEAGAGFPAVLVARYLVDARRVAIDGDG